MKLAEKSYPYPVVGNRDDVPAADFQAALQVTFDAETAFITVDVAMSSSSLSELVRSGGASFCLHVECSNTLFRSVFYSIEQSFRVAIPLSEINNVVEATVTAVASQEIEEYRVEGQHADYGAHSFYVSKGGILATYPTFRFDVEREYDAFEHLDSIVTITQGGDDDGPMTVSYDDEKLVVYLCKRDYIAYGRMLHSSVSPILSATIVLPIIADAIRTYRQEPQDYDYRWARALVEQIGEDRLANGEEPLVLAQQVLELPLRRALAAAETAMESNN